MTFQQLFQAWKARTGWSEARIAERLGVSHAAVNQWLNDKARPSLGQLPALAQLMGTTWQELAAIILGEEYAVPEALRPELSALMSDATTLTEDEVNRLRQVIPAIKR